DGEAVRAVERVALPERAKRAWPAVGADPDLVDLPRGRVPTAEPGGALLADEQMPPVAGEDDPGGPELEAVEPRIVEPRPRHSAAAAHPPDRRGGHIGPVDVTPTHT